MGLISRVSSRTYRKSTMVFDLSDNQKIGIGLTGFGVTFLFLGMILFFDRVLLAFGNVLFVAGLAFIIGFQRTFNFFFQKHKLKGSSLFFTGIFMILLGWTMIGMAVQTYGFWLLFSGFFPAIISFAKRLPVIGNFLSSGPLGKWLEKYESPGMA